jgi:hypothetical protein
MVFDSVFRVSASEYVDSETASYCSLRRPRPTHRHVCSIDIIAPEHSQKSMLPTGPTRRAKEEEQDNKSQSTAVRHSPV